MFRVRFDIDGISAIYDLDSFGKNVVTFGSDDDSDIVIKELPHVSGKHGCFIKTAEEWYIRSFEKIRCDGKCISTCLLSNLPFELLRRNEVPFNITISTVPLDDTEEKCIDRINHGIQVAGQNISSSKNVNNSYENNYNEELENNSYEGELPIANDSGNSSMADVVLDVIYLIFGIASGVVSSLILNIMYMRMINDFRNDGLDFLVDSHANYIYNFDLKWEYRVIWFICIASVVLTLILFNKFYVSNNKNLKKKIFFISINAIVLIVSLFIGLNILWWLKENVVWIIVILFLLIGIGIDVPILIIEGTIEGTKFVAKVYEK